MRSILSFIRVLPLFWGVCFSFASLTAASADALSPPPQRIQVCCSAIRASEQDIDDLGINFDLMLCDSSLKPSDTSLPVTASRRFAQVKRGSDADRVFSHLVMQHYSVFIAPTLTIVDGYSSALSFSKLKDPGIAKTSKLIVTPRVNSDGTIALSLSPQFQFAWVPGPGNKAAAAMIEAFPIQLTLSRGSLLIFTESPTPLLGPRFGEVFPVIPSGSNRFAEDMHSTRLWVFITATVLPNEQGTITL